MEDKVEFLKSNPTKAYTLTDIEVLGLIPWAHNGRTIRKAIETDLGGANLLQATVTGLGSQRRYTVTKKGLLKYLQIYGPALMATVRKPKQTYGGKKSATVQKRARPKSDAGR